MRVDQRLVEAVLGLTPTEAEIAVLLAEGRTVRQIAEATGRGYSTVRSHLKHTFSKLGVRRQFEVAQAVHSLSILPGSEGTGPWATVLRDRTFQRPLAGPFPSRWSDYPLNNTEPIAARRTDQESVGMAAHLTWRIAYAPRARSWRYPLPLSGELEWRAQRVLEAEVPLPTLPAEHVVVPSFSSLEGFDHLWRLDCGDASSFTASFGDQSGQYAHFEGIQGVRARPDYFTTSQAISNARLRLLVDTVKPPRDYLVTVSVRPVTAKTKDVPTADTPLLDIPPTKTMPSKKWEFGRRICSATCVSMAMDYLGVDHALHDLVIAAYHRPSDRYGIWPQNLWAASRWGVVGATETTTDWKVLERAVADGHPFAPLIAFDEGDLEGSPIPASLGHMVIVRGIQNKRVVVHDPVAQDVVSVPRHYDADEFRKAWLGAMGFFYLFAVPTSYT